MEKPPEIIFRDVDRTPDIEQLIVEKFEKLDTLYDNIISCQLAVERPQRHQKTGSPYRVRLEVRVPPGKQILTTREPGQGDMHEEVDVAIRDVFESTFRQVKKLGEIQRGDTKKHLEQDETGIVREVNPGADHGFIRSHTGRDIYFHRNSVINTEIDDIDVGTAVRFETAMTEAGMQASTVQVIDPRGVSDKERQ